MRVLFLTPQLPYPPHQGTSLRNFNLIAQLASRHSIGLLAFLEPDQALTRDGPLSELCEWVDVLPVPERSTGRRLRQMLLNPHPDMAWRLWSTDFRDRLAYRLQESAFDVVQIEGIEMAPYLPVVESIQPRPRLVYDDHNAEWVLQKRACLADLRIPSRWPAAFYSWIQWQRLRRYEAGICRRCDRVVVASEADRQAIQAIAPEVGAQVVPNGVDLGEYIEYKGPKETFDLVFTGKMDFRPNIDAMLWFCQDVLPLIRRERPETSLAIVGQRPHARLEALRRIPGVTITGWVEDVQPYIAGAAVFVAPLRFGGGTRLKLMQAMAMEAAVVSSSLGAEGFAFENGKHLILADSAQEFAEAVLSLLDNPDWRRDLGKAARHLVESNYGWDRLVRDLESLYEEAS